MIDKNIRILLATFYTPGIYVLEYLFGLGLKPSQIAVLSHDHERNRALCEYTDVHGIQLNTRSVKSPETQAWIRQFAPDMLFSLYFRDIFPREIVEIPRLGSVNLHPSLLPEYRGAFSAPWVIFNGEKQTGFTYHYMTEQVDGGNILLQKTIEIHENDTAFSLYHRLIGEGVSAFGQVLELVMSGEGGVAQTGEPSYYPRAVPNNGIIDDNWAAAKIERFLRALFFPPFKGAVAIRDDQEIEVHSLQHYKEITPGFNPDID
jgi:methionyl-tRNA formyltransferase